MNEAPPKLAIYGTGQFGQYVARLAVERAWPIVAAFNRAGPKVGQDIGRLAGLGHDVGVVVQDCDTADFTTVQADIGVVTVSNSLRENLPAYERLLGAGMNVICHGAEAYNPYANDPELAAHIDALAKQKRLTFTGSGIWDMSRIWAGILVAGPCTDIRSLQHSSITDATRAGLAQMLITGVGLSVAEFGKRLAGANRIVSVYRTITETVLGALGYTVARSAVRVEPVVFDAPIECTLLERSISSGEVAGTRIVCETTTAEGVNAAATIELRLLREGEVEHMVWSVDGQPRSSIRTERDDSAHATAASLFNRIPDVLAAHPGIVTIVEMGPLMHTAGRRGQGMRRCGGHG